MPERQGCALVTGASRGIGAAIARALASDGWPVGVNYRVDRDRAHAVVDEIERGGGRALAIAGDVSDPAVPDELFKALEEQFEAPVLVLVNNAGITRDDLTPSLGDDEWAAVLDTNLTAAFRLTRRALKPMLRARSGRITDVSTDLLDAVPAKRAGTPAEVAACVRFLASEEASYVTGAVLSVDGGLAA